MEPYNATGAPLRQEEKEEELSLGGLPSPGLTVGRRGPGRDPADQEVLLWLPYALLSLVLVGLLVASFLRFHVRNGYKYRRRREQLRRDLNAARSIILHSQTVHRRPRSGSRQQRVNEPRDGMTSLSSSAPHVAWSDFFEGNPRKTPKPEVTSARSTSGNSRRHSRCRKMALPKDSDRTAPDILEQFRSSVCRRSRTKQRRTSVVFNSNMNGSMVNVQCGDRESLRTFRKTSSGLDLTLTSAFHLSSRRGHSSIRHASRRPNIWTVQTDYRPKLPLSGLGVLDSGNSGIDDDDHDVMIQVAPEYPKHLDK